MNMIITIPDLKHFVKCEIRYKRFTSNVADYHSDVYSNFCRLAFTAVSLTPVAVVWRAQRQATTTFNCNASKRVSRLVPDTFLEGPTCQSPASRLYTKQAHQYFP